jgi:hypothetical protein
MSLALGLNGGVLTRRVLRDEKVVELPLCRACGRELAGFLTPHEPGLCSRRHGEERYRPGIERERYPAPKLYPGGDLPPGKPSWVGPIEPALPHVRLFAFVGDLSGYGVWAEVGQPSRTFPRFAKLRMVDANGEVISPAFDHHDPEASESP